MESLNEIEPELLNDKDVELLFENRSELLVDKDTLVDRTESLKLNRALR